MKTLWRRDKRGSAAFRRPEARRHFRFPAICLASLAFLAGAGAAAQNIKSLRAQSAEEADLAAEAAYTSKVCGRSISASIDWSSAGSWPAGESLADACGGALSAIESLCRAGDAPPVDDFVCAGDGSGPSFSGGAFTFGASPGDNGYDAAMAYLQSL